MSCDLFLKFWDPSVSLKWVKLKTSNLLCGLLFLTYVNDISTAIPGSKLKLFADDTNLFMFVIDKSELCTNCNISLESLNRWLVANLLSMNLDKTNIMVFPSNKK